MQRTITEFKLRKARFEQIRTGLADQSTNLSRQVRRLPRDITYRKKLDRILTSRITEKENSNLGQRKRIDRLSTDITFSSAGIDGLTLLTHPAQTVRRR